MSTDRCSACTGEYHCIPGDGPSPCRVIMCAQNPGKTEEASACRGEFGRVLIGEAGRELWEHYCALAGITRQDDVFATNVVHCHTTGDRKPSLKEIRACADKFLRQEIEDHNPEVICLLGAAACSLIPELWLEAHHGFSRKVSLFGQERIVVPMFHPAAGLHDPSMMVPLIEDFERLRRILAGDHSCPVDEYPDPTYIDLTGDYEAIRHYSSPDRVSESDRFMARDTEYLQEKNSPYKQPFCVTFSVLDGEGFMIRATDHDGLKILGESMPQFRSILHNSLADLDVEHAMGLPYCDFADTMQIASHVGGLPQKLKALAWRLAGMTMEDYEDVVMPYSRQAVLDWLEHAYDIAVLTPGVKYVPKKRKIPKTEKALSKLMKELEGHTLEQREDGYLHFQIAEECDSTLVKKVLHVYKHTSKPVPADGTPYSPWQAWREQIVEGLGPEIANEITTRIGEMPKASIEQVFIRDKPKAVRYACRDSDSTRRIYPVLKDRSHKYDGRVMLGDIDT